MMVLVITPPNLGTYLLPTSDLASALLYPPIGIGLTCVMLYFYLYKHKLFLKFSVSFDVPVNSKEVFLCSFHKI